MKKYFGLLIVGLLVLVYVQSVKAQTTPAPSPDTVFTSDTDVPVNAQPSPGTTFTNSADGQCTVAGASCTLPDKTTGVCADNGQGSGVCTSVVPTIDPLFATGCGPNEICHIVPEKVGRRNGVGQSKTKDCGGSPCNGDPWSFVQNWIGQVVPQSIYHYGTQLLASFGFQMFDAFSQDLKPAALQAQTLYDTAPKRYCQTSRLCVYDPVTHKLVGDYLTQQTWCTTDPPGRADLIMGTRDAAGDMLGSYKYSVPTDLRLPDTVVKKLAAPPCNGQIGPGKVMSLDTLSYTEQNYYGSDTITQFAITIQTDMISIIDKTIRTVVDGVTSISHTKDYIATEHTPAYDIGGGENSMASSLAGLSFHVTTTDLADFAYPSDQAKAKLAQGGGVWDTYRNDAYAADYKSPLDAIYKDQTWFYGMAGEGDMTSPTLQSMNARQQAAQTFGNCSIIPAAQQASLFPNGDCNQNWLGTSPTPTIAPVPPNPQGIRNAQDAAEPRTPTPTKKNAQCPNPNYSVGAGWSSSSVASAITSAASTAEVPACVLQGVTDIEWDDSPAQGACVPNQCAAAGPFQISVGVDSCGKKTCDNCGAGWAGRACNDETWALQKAGGSAASACDPKISALAAAYVLIGKAKYFGYDLTTNGSAFDPNNTTQRNAIMYGADAYYGVTSTISRLQGAGGQALSYGEDVYQTCVNEQNNQPDGTQTINHTNHSFPTNNSSVSD